MSFQLRREVLKKAIDDGIETIRILPYYYGYAVCIKVYPNGKYELWNYETIPLSTVAKVVEYFLLEEQRNLKILYIDDKKFDIPKENIREKLFDFLTELEKSKLKKDI